MSIKMNGHMRKNNDQNNNNNNRNNNNWCQLTLILAALLFSVATAEKQKRQIFREQVLPALGGKIPEEAFRTDRLALNRLNKEGISIPDGVVLDARHIHKHPHTSQHMPKIIKVYLTPDGRYVPPEGRTHYDRPKAVDTTYIIRTPFGKNDKPLNNFGNYKHHRGHNKQEPYPNHRQQFVPLIPPTKPGVYKPIVTQLMLPVNPNILNQPYLPSWDLEYDWDTIYRPFNDYYVDNIALFNSHQILMDYQGFLDEFHGRSLRHVSNKSNDKNNYNNADRYKYNSKNIPTNNHSNDYRNIGSIISNISYTNLTQIPETGFSCRGRKGIFADVDTKCQVFHNCSGWSRTSSLCPVGTAFSEEKNRCEWWNTVQCKK
ncbi:PREDICTED: uncharacterized protein LOC107073381 [Polistes dominula]|uniref:Uncharacterized protein LOC107073381 n=1 Tax=Polistes dominula TaxID=743375 RepID=A0ABM1JAK4_POLDO|nr:PREDICTED: uncharacterized protein LOC107073381 [Polistes dominula]XP_015189492.1 PREDICTED: uncharacterized protein LOC107073381 [Polistes dominula]